MNINDIKNNIKITSSTKYMDYNYIVVNKVLFSSHSDSNNTLFKIVTTFNSGCFIPSDINIIKTNNCTDEHESISIFVRENDIAYFSNVYNKSTEKYTNEQCLISTELFNLYLYSNEDEKFQLSTTLDNLQFFSCNMIELLSMHYKTIFQTP